METGATPVLVWLTLLLSTLNFQLSTCLAQGTAFTCQGRLNDGASQEGGSFDLRFALCDAATDVTNGLFTVTLDIGAGVFTGADRWLEIGVRTNGGGTFTTLTPRQPITSTPYAIFAANAGSAATAASVPWSGLSGVPAGFADGVDHNTTYTAGTGPAALPARLYRLTQQ